MLNNGGIMKVTVLIEDTSVTKELTAEHGLSLYIETQNGNIIMDTGASDLTWDNADKLGIDVSEADKVIISHGHYDHAGGLIGLAERNPKADIYIRKSAFGDFRHNDRYIGIDKNICNLPDLHFIDGPVNKIGDGVTLFSEITENKMIPDGNSELLKVTENGAVCDDFCHEQYLVIEENGKKVLLSGCAHNGIVNIVNRCKEIYGEYPHAVISGFHTVKKTDYSENDIYKLKCLASELSKIPSVFYTGHCTGERTFDIMKKIMGEKLVMIHTGDTVII